MGFSEAIDLILGHKMHRTDALPIAKFQAILPRKTLNAEVNHTNAQVAMQCIVCTLFVGKHQR